MSGCELDAAPARRWKIVERNCCMVQADAGNQSYSEMLVGPVEKPLGVFQRKKNLDVALRTRTFDGSFAPIKPVMQAAALAAAHLIIQDKADEIQFDMSAARVGCGNYKFSAIVDRTLYCLGWTCSYKLVGSDTIVRYTLSKAHE